MSQVRWAEARSPTKGVALRSYAPLNQDLKWFSERWNVYKNLIRNNYLYHYDIHGCLHKILAGHFSTTPFSLLDLGCGDASFIANTLKGTTVSRYYGIDLSEVALKEAARNLDESAFESTLLCGNVAESIVQLPEDYNAIVCGYSLHHYERYNINCLSALLMLQSYFDECAFRFNRKLSTHRGNLFYRLIQQELMTSPVQLRDILGNSY